MDNINKATFKLGEWIWLDQPQQIIRIESGEVELYAIDNSDNADGIRTFVAVKQVGDCLMGLPPNKVVRLLAIATTEVIASVYDNREHLTAEEEIEITEQTIAFFLGWPRDEVHLRQYQELGVSESISLKPYDNIQVVQDKRVCWLKLEPGQFKSDVYGDFLTNSKPVFPVINNGFLTALEQAGVSILTTAEVLAIYGQDFLQSYISLISDDFCRKLTEYFQESKLAADEKLQQKRTEKEMLVHNSYTELMSNLIPELSVVITPESKKLPPVINVLQLIAEHLGIAKQKIKLDASLEHITSVEEIIKLISRTTSLHGRKVRLEANWHTGDQGPLLVFQQDKPLAAIPSSPEKYELFDLTCGRRQPIDAKAADELSDEAYAFYVNLPAGKSGFWDTLKWAAAKCFKDDYWMLLWTCIIAGIIPIVTPLITQSVFYDIIPSYDKQAHLMVIQVMLITTISAGLVNLVRNLAVLRIKNKIRSTMEAAIWLKFLSLPSAFFRKYQTGDLTMRMQIIQTISSGLSSVISNGLFNGIFSFWNLLVMVYYEPKLSIVAVFIWLIYLILAGILSWRQVKFQRSQIEASGKVAGQTLQILKGLNKFRVAAAEERAFYLWAQKFGVEWKWNRKTRWQQNWLELLGQVMPIMMNFFIFWLTIEWIDQGLKDHSSYLIQANFLGFNSALGGFGASISGLISSFAALWSIKPALERLEPILAAESEVTENKVPAGELAGNIEICDVEFRYAPERPLVINKVSLTIKSGQFVGIVGSSGSGKSSLLRLLLGMEKPEKGVILYDDQDLNEMDVTSVRRQMGVVLQHGQLMSDSIFANIVGSLPLTIDDAWQAAQMVGLGDDIRSMPMEMHTVISEGASNISGGQRQRILIARSIVQSPRIVIFDEATSALDNHTQAIVSDTLEKMRATRIVVAHRLSTIKKADVIVVMDKGEIVEIGNYEELMQKSGLFTELAKRQIA